MHWRAAARGSSWYSPAPARSALRMAFCRAPGRLEWSRQYGRSWPCAAGIAPGNEDWSEFVQPVERGHLIGLRQRGIVKYGIPEIFDGRSHRQHRLSNVHDLRRPIPDNVYAQQFQRIRIKQNLQQTLIVAQH